MSGWSNPREVHMKILVGYASGYGSTSTYAQVVGEELRSAGHDAEVREAREVKSLDEYDYVVVGGSLRAGNWLAPAKKLAKRTIRARKPHSVFICCLSAASDKGKESLANVVLPKLQESLPGLNLESAGLFPGARNTDQYGFIVKKVMVSISRKEGDEKPEETRDYRDFELARSWAADLTRRIGS